MIKGMVCDRCIKSVKGQLEKIGLHPTEVSLGQVRFADNAQLVNTAAIETELVPLGFSLLEDKKAKLVRDIKALVNEMFSGDFDFPVRFRFSQFAAQRLGKDYDTISSTFSSSESITIEKYIIQFRIEKVKELLVYTSETLADISFKLGFSSIAHLSRQFKNVTGFNPSHFRAIRKDKQLISQVVDVPE